MDFQEVTNTIVNVIIVILCTFGNLLIIISLKKFEWLRVTTNYFVALLAFYDFVMDSLLHLSWQLPHLLAYKMITLQLNMMLSVK